MAALSDAFNSVFRRYNVDGVPGSGTRNPAKSEQRALGATIEGYIAASLSALNGTIDARIDGVDARIDSAFDALDSLVSYGAIPNSTSSEAKAANSAALLAAGLTTTDLGFGGVDIPTSLYYTNTPANELPPFGGRGSVIDAAGNRRGRYFSWITDEPTVRAPDDGENINTAFNGDFSYVQFLVEHRITGDALGSAPVVTSFDEGLRAWTPEAYPYYTNLYVEAGDKHDIFITTIGSADHIDVVNNSLGDVAARTTRVVAAKVKTSFTGTIDNGWALGDLIEAIGTVAGAQLVGHEVNGYDQGFDIGYVGYNSWGMRTNATGAKYAHWIDYVAKSAGGDLAHDLAYALYGPFRIGTNYAGADFDEAGYEGAAITMKAGQGIFWNTSDGAVPDDYRWIPGVLGSVFSGYSAADSALTHLNGTSGLLIYSDGIKFAGKLGFGVTPIAKPNVAGSDGGIAGLTALRTALANLGLITNS
ncbi:hypothetical protein SAMN02745157_0706 [Kaistia soli DSM 19436]|uniref:Uncharacterized protein n=1 Tax=Kaistia soli DSM 19436 TaxID=1122133 RepID=A0A1M4VHC7_9HYPH|nr:hypothetical protein [Kaistia soli]SHE68421.1 hypothetical protein SAMN02745157_0706 [Kaistia soli DSM 19436]